MKLLFVLILIKPSNTKPFFISKRLGLSQHQSKALLSLSPTWHLVPQIKYSGFSKEKFAYLSPYFRKEVC